MNREIEFRGRSVSDGVWVYGDLEYERNKGLLSKVRIHTYKDDGSYDRQHLVESKTIGQFTGLHDRDGKEIYEGDILKLVVTNIFDKSVSKPKIRKVIWKDCGFEIVDKYNSCICDKVVSSDVLEYTVVGNIYDNLELLDTK